MVFKKSGDAFAIRMGRKGARVQAKKMTPEQRSERARKAALGRWGTKKKDEEKK